MPAGFHRFLGAEVLDSSRTIDVATSLVLLGTYVCYLVYSVGKLMLLKLRRDYKEAQKGKFSMRAFHDAVLAQGNAPFWAHRRLLLPEGSDAVLE